MKEFLAMLAAHSGVQDAALLEQDVRLHLLLRDLVQHPDLGTRLVFRGGTCLVKCYLGYYRFSVDLDFTATGGAETARLGAKEARRQLRPLQRQIAVTLADHAARETLQFDPRRDLKFGQSNRMMTAFLHYESTSRRVMTIKVDFNFAEPLEFSPKRLDAVGLLRTPFAASIALVDSDLPDRYGAPIPVTAYEPREILAEKGRALLTRRAAKTRDLVDLFLLERDLGLHLAEFLPAVRTKTARAIAAASRYRENLKLIETRFDFMRGDDPTSLLLKPLDNDAFGKYRDPVLDALLVEAEALRVVGTKS